MAGQPKILVIDDDPSICEVVRDCLKVAAFDVETAYNGKDVIDRIKAEEIELAIVDLNLPGEDGLSLTRRIKDQTSAGIIILTGRTDPTERVIGLEMGADDYVCKPFEPRELQARVKSVLRRLQPKVAPTGAAGFRFNGWSLDTVTRSLAAPNGDPTHLTTGEYGLLLALVEHAPDVLSRQMLISLTHQNDTPAFERSIDVQIGRLRKKLMEAEGGGPFIKTVRNAGYTFAAPVEAF